MRTFGSQRHLNGLVFLHQTGDDPPARQPDAGRLAHQPGGERQTRHRNAEPAATAVDPHLVARGKSLKEIGYELALSSKTVETYKARGTSKLNISGRREIVEYAIRAGWV